MLGTILLLGLLSVASVSDVRYKKVYNWTTYPGVVIAILASGLATLTGIDMVSGDLRATVLWGLVPLSDSFGGFAACGFLMVFCYACFPGGVGGGDVKLIAMVGAFLGLFDGLSAMLWTFVLAGCMALIVIVWRSGPRVLWRLAYGLVARMFWRPTELSDTDRQALTGELFLSPSALLAVAIVRYPLIEQVFRAEV